MKFIIRNNQVETEQGERVQPLYVSEFASMFRELSSLPEGTEINMHNVWDTYYNRRDNLLVLKSHCLEYDITKQVNIDSNESEVNSNGFTGNNLSDNECGIPDSMHNSTVQEQPTDVNEVPGDNSGEHQNVGEASTDNTGQE